MPLLDSDLLGVLLFGISIFTCTFADAVKIWLQVAVEFLPEALNLVLHV